MYQPVLAEADAFYLKAESPVVSSKWAFGALLDGAGRSPVTIDELRHQIAERVVTTPWLAWRIAGVGRRPARYRWLDAAPLPIEEMVTVERLGPDGDLASRIGELVMEDLGFDLPMWRVRLIEPGDGSQGVVLDGHHAFAGGFAGNEMLDVLFGAAPRAAATDVPSMPSSLSRRAVLADMAWNTAARARRSMLRVAPTPRWRPARAGEPLVGPLSSTRRVVSRHLPQARLAAISQAHGAGRTRVVTALISTALDELAGAEVASLRALFPHGTQEGPVVGPGNAARSTFLDLPLHLPPAERLAALKLAFAANANQGPQPPTAADLVLTYPPPTPECWVAGRRMVDIVAAGPLRVCSRPNTRLTIAVHAYTDVMTVSFTADGASLGREVDGLADRLVAALDEYERQSVARR